MQIVLGMWMKGSEMSMRGPGVYVNGQGHQWTGQRCKGMWVRESRIINNCIPGISFTKSMRW